MSFSHQLSNVKEVMQQGVELGLTHHARSLVSSSTALFHAMLLGFKRVAARTQKKKKKKKKKKKIKQKIKK